MKYLINRLHSKSPGASQPVFIQIYGLIHVFSAFTRPQATFKVPCQLMGWGRQRDLLKLNGNILEIILTIRSYNLQFSKQITYSSDKLTTGNILNQFNPVYRHITH
jgi:hypothetical protein